MSSVSFAEGDYVVYPTHGVGQVMAIENQEIGGMKLQLFVITFERDRMTLRAGGQEPPSRVCASCPRAR